MLQYPPQYQQHQLQEPEIEQIKKHYRFTQEDEAILLSLRPMAELSLDALLNGFYDFIFEFEHARHFLKSEEVMQKHQEGLSGWFLNLFNGEYDTPYFNKLNVISETHVKIGLPSHYVHAAFSFVRQFLEKYFTENGNAAHILSIHKIIDINLDILSLTYKEESQHKLLEEVILIKQSIKNDDVIPYVQPIVDAKTGKISKYECLMRLYDKSNDTLHSIYPLLKTAKETLLYEALMAQMLEKSFAIFEKLPYSFSINLSYDDIVNDSCREQICKQLKSFPDTKRVIFEILETDFIIDFDIVIEFIKEVKTHECKIAIDDFGSGYSNIENILKFNPDYIKIDGSLIYEIDHSSEALIIVKNVLNIAKDIQAETIAEYVHNREVYEVLQTLDVDYLQGYYIEKPFPAENLLKT